MIKNERQYRITRGQLDRFRTVREELGTREPANGDELRRKLETAAVEAQVSELTAELDEYDNLRNSTTAVGGLESLDELPRLMIRARIASGLTQRDLADRLGMQEQQVQRYEANDWRTASLSRLIEVAEVLGITIGNSLLGSASSADAERKDLARQLQRAGLDSGFVQRRLAPAGSNDPEEIGTVLDLAARVHRIYGWTPSDVLAGKDLDVDMPVAVGFKLPKRTNEPRLRAYTVYAHYLALLALDATASVEARAIPGTAKAFRAAVLARYENVDFESALQFIWELGIPVVPLADPGAFHAVLWRAGGRNAVVLKQQNRTPSRWLFDLLHEIRHALEEPGTADYAVVDDDRDAREDSEVAANQFAGDVLLDGRAEDLTQECVAEARGSIERLKSAVPRVASRNHVETADLANYVAYRLSLQGENWWGAATNLQQQGTDPWITARDNFFARTDLSSLTPLDRGLLAQALAG